MNNNQILIEQTLINRLKKLGFKSFKDIQPPIQVISNYLSNLQSEFTADMECWDSFSFTIKVPRVSKEMIKELNNLDICPEWKRSKIRIWATEVSLNSIRIHLSNDYAQYEEDEENPEIPNMLNSPGWKDFEPKFRECWHSNHTGAILADYIHHVEVANLAAYNLSKRYGSFEELVQTQGITWPSIAQVEYSNAAFKLYPNEVLWDGTEAENPEFWREHLKSRDIPLSEKRRIWAIITLGKIPFQDL